MDRLHHNQSRMGWQRHKEESGPIREPLSVRERFLHGVSRVRTFLSECVDIIAVEEDDEAWMVEEPRTQPSSTLLSKVVHPVRSTHEALDGLTRASGSVNGMPRHDAESLTGLDPQEEAMFRSVGIEASGGIEQ